MKIASYLFFTLSILFAFSANAAPPILRPLTSDLPQFKQDKTGKELDFYKTAMAKGLWNDGQAAQRFRRVEGDNPVSLLSALVKAFPNQPADLFTKCLDGGDILVNGKPTTSTVKVTRKDQVLHLIIHTQQPN